MQVNVSKWLWPLLEEQKKIRWINGESTWGEGVRFVKITDSIFHVSKIRLEFPHMIRVIITSPMNKIFEFFYFLGKNPQYGPPPIHCPCLQLHEPVRGSTEFALP